MATDKIGTIGTAAVRIAASVGGAITAGVKATASAATAGLAEAAGTFSALAEKVTTVATSVVPSVAGRLEKLPYEEPKSSSDGWFTGLVRAGSSIVTSLQTRFDTAWDVLVGTEEIQRDKLVELREEFSDVSNMFNFLNQLNRQTWETFTHVSDAEKERRRDEAREADEAQRRTKYL